MGTTIGNYNTPYNSQCIEKYSGDNVNFFYIYHARSFPTTHVSGGFSIFGNVKTNQENIEGPVHCHGFAWGNDENDLANMYKRKKKSMSACMITCTKGDR